MAVKEKKKDTGASFDEFVEDTERAKTEDTQPGTYEIVIPPGVPQKLIIETASKFSLEVSKRKVALKTIDLEPENLLVLRGELDSVNQAYDYMYAKMKEMYGK
ncbi:MAG TPA: hypothetical protein HA257_06115 [Candidatus Methanoperedenaceae archaeon]|nr:hypothetical protein [Candidatus Methanoperedenaceae archaeon]